MSPAMTGPFRYQRLLEVAGLMVCSVVLVLTACFLYIDPQVPPIETFRQVRLKEPLRIFSRDGKLIQEFGERLIPIRFEEIPQQFMNALLDTEDKRFFEHRGVDLVTFLKASVNQLLNPGEIGPGGSTITMQLVKNISGSSEATLIRKLKEILLAIKLERELSKQQILELYLNIIPYGKHAFGIEAASNIYYGKSLRELSLPQMAMLAGVPKAPERNNPVNNPRGATQRRDLVLRRMLDQGSITEAQFQAAIATPDNARVWSRKIGVEAPYVAELVRRQLHSQYGDSIYTSGFEVYTTIDSHQQQAAQTALTRQLLAYDRRHGYRGPEQRANGGGSADAAPHLYPATWVQALSTIPAIAGQQAAMVLAANEEGLEVLTLDAQEHALVVALKPPQFKWARAFKSVNARGPTPKSGAELASRGDLVRLQRSPDGTWELGQVPEVQGALVALDPTNGGVRALVGGLDFLLGQFDHATQARRQPGSVFKPFIYTSALENGLTPATLLNDQPVVLEGGQLDEPYRPRNSGNEFRGKIRLREALYRSINLVSLRIVLSVSPDRIVETAERFGFDVRSFPRDAQLAFGGGTIALTPLEVATAYASFANGGFKVRSHLIERIVDRGEGRSYRTITPVACQTCEPGDGVAPRIIDEQVAYIMNDMLRDVVQQGTGRKASLKLKRSDLSGKTGTTNDADIWFSGYHPDLVASVWVGFDDNRSLGSAEFGATAPLETWIDFMAQVLPTEQAPPPPLPLGIVQVRINKETGLRTTPDDPDAIFEIFRDGTQPAEMPAALATEHGEAQPTQNVF